jgi:tRNA pseudouridine13 synthase
LPWCRGDYERALWLALTDENVHDRPHEREEKHYLRLHWTDWATCRKSCPYSKYAAVLAHLSENPGDFRRAIARVPQELRSLWLAAFQSHLWNQILATAISDTFDAADLTWHTIGKRSLPYLSPLTDARHSPLSEMLLPLPSARLHIDDMPLQDLYEKALAKEGLQLREIRVKYPRDSFFSKGERAAIFWPERFHEPTVEHDDLHREKHKLTLRFSLNRGMYATMFIKAITQQVQPGPIEETDTADEYVDIQ